MIRKLLHFIAAYHAVLHQAPRLDPDALRRLQERKLQTLLTGALHDTPFVQRQWSASGLARQEAAQANLEMLARVRPVTKMDFLAAPSGSAIAGRFANTRLQHEKSTGTSGNPFTVYFDSHYVTNRNLRFLRALHATGYRWPMSMLLITGDRDRKSSPGRRWYYTSLKASLQEWYDLLLKTRPQVLYGCTTPLRLLASHIREHGLPAHHPSIVITTAETLDGATRRLLAETFHSEVFDFYGMTEMGLVAWECKAHAGYHLAEDAILIERLPIATSTAAATGPGPFRLLYTNLELSAMPLIRYESGDTAWGYTTAPCACGCRLPRIERFEGRVIDSIRLPDGTLLSPYRFTCTLEEIPGMKRYRVVQLTSTLVRIEIENNPATDVAVLAAAAQRVAAGLLPSTMHLETHVVDRLDTPPGRKFRPVECRLDRP